MGAPENKVTKDIRKILKTARLFHFKHKASLGSFKGVSDILGVKTVKVADLVRDKIDEVGIFVAIEVKKEGTRKGSPDQEKFISNIKKAGGIGFITDNVYDVIRFLHLDKELMPMFTHIGRKPRKED